MLKFLRLLLAASCMTLNTQATDLALKLDLTSQAQGIVKQIIQAGNLDTASDSNLLVKIPHVTIGFIQNLQDKAEAQKIGCIAQQFIDTYLLNNPIQLEISTCLVKFNKITALEPTSSSIAALKNLNLALEQYLNTLGYRLNNLTTNSNYTPHLTLKNHTTGSNRLVSMNTHIQNLQSKRTDQKLFFKLQSSSFSTK